MKVFFTSDSHFGHDRIREYCGRPFKDLELMDAAIIRNHNARVKKEDIVIHLGDFCFKNTSGGKEGEGSLNKAQYYLNQLNGMFTFIVGNHDRHNSMNSIIRHCVIIHGGQEIFCVHDPANYNSKYKINLVGHVHEAWKVKKIKHNILVNVGVDVWNFRPIDINEIMAAIAKFEKGEKDECERLKKET